jgi:hypothetical protein
MGIFDKRGDTASVVGGGQIVQGIGNSVGGKSAEVSSAFAGLTPAQRIEMVQAAKGMGSSTYNFALNLNAGVATDIPLSIANNLLGLIRKVSGR